MTAIVFKKFAGWIPSAPAELLPNDAAQEASFCDFSKGILSPLKDQEYIGKTLSNASGNAVRGLYTRDGLNFYTWTVPVYAYQSPVNNESIGRVYYAYERMFNVSFLPENLGVDYAYGGTPAKDPVNPNNGNRWRVGVPYQNLPGAAGMPALTLVDRDSLPDYPAAQLTVSVWWDVNGVAQNKQNVNINVVTPWKEFTFTAPAAPEGTDDEPIYDPQLVVQLELKEGSQVLFLLNTKAKSSEPVRTAALPGGIEIMVSLVNDSTYKITMSWGVMETRAYVFTHVNQWEEESAPSRPALISPTYLQDVRVRCERADFVTDWYRPWAETRIYRTFGSSANYLRVDATAETLSEQPGGEGTAFYDTYLDSTRTPSGISTGLVSLDWFPPEEMDHAVLANNGWFVGYTNNDTTLYMSEPYRPHAWPYSVTFNKGIKGIAVAPQALVVTTVDACYLVTGPHPKSVVVNKLPIPVGGISQHTICQVEGGVAFLSNDGIVFVEGSNASLDASQSLWTREKWRELYGNVLETMVLGYHDGFLIARDAGNAWTNVGFVVRLDEAGGSLTSYPHSVSGMFRLPDLDTLYVTSGKSLYRFRTGGANTMLWHSKDFIFPKYTPLGALYARTTGTVALQIYTIDSSGAKTLYWSTNTLPDSGYMRIPATNNGLSCAQRVWSFRLSGTGDVHELAFGQTMAELQRV